jgi:hypothetical protein
LASIGDREFELLPKKEAVSMSIQDFNLSMLKIEIYHAAKKVRTLLS